MSEIMKEFYKKGYEKGYEKGNLQKAKSMSIELAEMGMSVEQIAKAAKYDTETVKNWLNEDEEVEEYGTKK